jgi:raffinose/stachyose/melibiose transport system permease protein
MQRTTRKPFPIHIFVFLLPAAVIYTVFMVYPLFDSLRLSFFDQSVQGAPVFVGLANFQTLLGNSDWSVRFWNALGNNVVFFLIHMLVQNPLALLLASLLTVKQLRGRAIYRTLIFAPTTLSVVIIGFIWSLILSPIWGIFDGFLKAIGLGSIIQPWLGSDQTALVTVSLMSVWQWVGLPMVLFIAALLGIPEEFLEAARVDGASAWKVFTQIKLPLILPTVGIVGILTFVGNFNAFDLIYATQGLLATPNYHTDILGTFFYRTFYGFQLQPGNPTMGTTIAAMMFVIILGGVLIYLFGWQRRFANIQG